MKIAIIKRGSSKYIVDSIKKILNSKKEFRIIYGTEEIYSKNQMPLNNILHLDKDVFSMKIYYDEIIKTQSQPKYYDYWLIREVHRYMHTLITSEEEQETKIHNILLRRLSSIFEAHKEIGFKYSQLVLNEIFYLQEIIRKKEYEIFSIGHESIEIDHLTFLNKSFELDEIKNCSIVYGFIQERHKQVEIIVKKNNFALLPFLILKYYGYEFRKKTSHDNSESDIPILEKLYTTLHSYETDNYKEILSDLRIEENVYDDLISSLHTLKSFDLHTSFEPNGYGNYYFKSQLFGIKNGSFANHRREFVIFYLKKLNINIPEFEKSPREYLLRAIDGVAS